jgi:hypothetical protein
MTLLDNWREVLTRAWSMKLMGFAAFLEIAQQVVPYLDGILPWWASVLVILAAFVARLIPQEGLSKKPEAEAAEGASDGE